MSLTTAQNATLKAAMLGDANVIAIVGRDQAVADYYNAPSSPVVAIWRSDIRGVEIVSAITMTEFAALTALKQTCLTFMMEPNVIDATSANVRSAFNTIFGAGASLAALTAVAQRTGTRLEVLFSAGGPPATTTMYAHILTDVEVNAARNS
jgi:hypothetical protein